MNRNAILAVGCLFVAALVGFELATGGHGLILWSLLVMASILLFHWTREWLRSRKGSA